ncbi:YjcZ family sporulation protein [Paenibacillus sp. SN-8-1]
MSDCIKPVSCRPFTSTGEILVLFILLVIILSACFI